MGVFKISWGDAYGHEVGRAIFRPTSCPYRQRKLILNTPNKNEVVNYTPSDGILGTDPITGLTGVKWNTESAFTTGVFNFTLDRVYPVGATSVAVKAGTGVLQSMVAGPECSTVSKFGNQRQLGSLKILKSLSNSDGASVPASFTINYDCGAGYAGNVSVAAGDSATVSGIPTGSSCTVSEAALAPIAGYTWGTPVVTGSPAIIGKGTTVEVSIANLISRDQGYLKISKVFDAKTSGFAGTFAITYNCGTGDQTVNLAAGGSAIVGPLNTGTVCTVSEAALPTPPAGWTFGTPVISGSPATIIKGDVDGAIEVIVTNSIIRDPGYLKISKVFDAKTSGFVGTFAISYNCGNGEQTVNLAAGGSTTVGPFETGTVCTVSEPVLPTPPAGWIFSAPLISADEVTIVKGDAAAPAEVTVINSITPFAPAPPAAASLTLTKLVTQTQASSWAFTFTLTSEGGQVSEVVLTAVNPTVLWGDLDPALTYTLAEVDLGAGWAEGDFACSVGGVAVGEEQPSLAIQLTLNPGDNVVCTKYNADLGGSGGDPSPPTNLEPGQEPAMFAKWMFLPAVSR